MLAKEIEIRIKKLRQLVGVSGLAGALITRNSDVRYFSGFTGDDSLLLITSAKKYLITDGRYVEEAQQSTSGYDILTWKNHPATFAAKLLSKKANKKIGISDNDISVNWYKKILAEGLKTAPLDSVIASIREQKSEWEIEKITTSIQAIEAAFREFKGHVNVGMTEKELKLELELQMLDQGIEKPSFDTIVAEGVNSSLPHAHAGERVIKDKSILLIDFGGVIDGYCSDLTRTLFISEVTDLWRERYEVVLAAQMAGIVSIKCGREIKEADKAARAVFAGAECEEYFVHSLGHGVGIDVHESPRVSSKITTKMPAGAVVTVEPGLYYPGEGGIRIEDMVVVRNDRTTVLSSLEKDIESVVIG